jgi:gliding motility-associated-like protein
MITIVTNGNVVTSTAGTVVVIDQNNTEVIDIPIGTQVTLNISDPNSSCDDERIVNPPNCDCPDIPTPTGTPTYKICIADVPLTMSVMVEAGLSANWYDSEAGLVPSATLTLNFDHTNSAPGIYTYYVEAIDPVTDCVSQNRFKIEVEVVPNPTAVDVNPMLCDDDLDGFVAFDLLTIGNSINSNPNNTIAFYLSVADASSNMNPLVSPYTNVSDDQIIYAVITNPTGCINQATATLTVLDLPTYSLDINNEICLGDGLGTIAINDVIANGDVTTSINNNAFSNALNYDSLQVASYTLEVMDTSGCVSDTIFDIADGIELIVDAFVLDCDNKGTLSDATDDDYQMSFNIHNNLNFVGQYILFIDNVEIGRYDYESLNSIILPADGSTIDIRFEDELTGCSVSRLGGPLNPCSTTCVLTIDNLIFDCDNNGSDDNPLDDFYNVTINVSSINGSAANTYSLYVDGVLRGAGTYGVDFSFIVNATTDDVLINIQDSADNQCQISTTLDALDPCSNGCAVFLSIIDLECDNNGTILDKDDDFYNVRILADAVNTGSNTYNLNVDQVTEGVYTYGDTIDIILNADGLNHLLEAIDTNRPDCFAEANTGILNNCSTDCQIDIDASVPVCDNNGTNDDELDDTYTFTLQLTGGQGNGWSNSELSISGNYGEVITIGPLLISDGPLNLVFIDEDISECESSITITPPNPCSGCAQTMNLSVTGMIDCTNPSVPIEAVVSEMGTYLWTFQGGEVSSDLTAQAGSEGYYVFTVVFPDNCSLTDSVFVSSDDDIPVANGGEDKLINCNIDSVTLVGNMSTQGPDITYEWTDANGNIIGTGLELGVTTPGDYFLQVFDGASNCASAKDLVVVQENIDVPSVAIYANPGDVFDCIIANIILTTDNEPSTSYTWLTPEATFSDVNSISITSPGEYILIATNIISECFDTGRIEIISFQEYPIIELSAEDILDCEIESVTISADGSQTGASITYSWYDIDGNLISQTVGETSVTEPGEYVLVLEDSENGCTNSDTIEIISIENNIGIDIDPIIEVVQGETIILRPIINIPIEDIDTIIWDPTDGLSCVDCLEPTVLVDEDMTYTITIIDIYGCVGTATITIKAKINKDIFVPNIISPESNGGNDVFVIYTDDDLAVINKVLIYDRWGNKIYQNFNQIPNSPIGAWDGKFNGEIVAQGVYVYLIEAELSTGQKINLSGDLTVIR